MNKGWIKLHRAIQDCWIWNDEPFSKAQAWIDLLLLANHRDKKIGIDGKPVVISRGQFHTSINKLSDRWMWDRKKVMKFLDVLESDEMLYQKRTTKGTTLTIANYEVYQDEGTTDGTAIGTTDGTTIGTAIGTQTRIKELNNEININNKDKSKRFIPPTIEEVKTYCVERNNSVDPQTFVNFYESKGWYVGKNKMKDWKSAVRTWERARNDNKKKPDFMQRSYDFDDLEKSLIGG